MYKVIYVLILLLLFVLGCKKDESSPTQTPTTGTITGKVSTAVGDTAIASAVVSTNPQTSSLSTNSNGEYTIANVSPGNYTITSVKSGFFDGNANVKVTAGNSTSAIIQMIRIIDQSGMIKGVVKNSTGDSVIANANVTTSPSTSSVTTNSSGEYLISNIPVGAYTVTASKAGYNPGNTAIAVTAGQTTTGDIRMNVIVNHAPNTPVLISPSNSATGQDRSLTLTWSCNDVDGDNLFYDVYLDKTSTPTQKVASGQTSINYTASNLDSAATYYWRVVAKDSKGAVSNSSSVCSFSTINLRSGLAAYYPFNGNANDESGNGRNGTVYGSLLSADRFNNLGRAYNFNGSGDWIKANGTGLPKKERTVSIWFNATTQTTNSAWVCFLAYGSGCSTSWWPTVTKDMTNFSVGVHCAGSTLLYESPTALINQWHNWVLVNDASGQKYYIDGILVASNQDFINNTGESVDLCLAVCLHVYSAQGPYTDLSVDYYKGLLDDIRIYNRALTEAELQALYHEGGW